MTRIVILYILFSSYLPDRVACVWNFSSSLRLHDVDVLKKMKLVVAQYDGS